MQKYKVVTLLKSFSSYELKNFENFLSSPYFNTRKKPLSLFLALKKELGKLDGDSFPKEKIYRKIYGQKKEFNNNTFNDLTSQLFHLAEEFLYIENVRGNERKKNIFLTQKYSEKGFETLFPNKKSQLKKLITAHNSLDSDFFDDVYNMKINDINFFQIHKSIKKQKDFDFVIKAIMNLTADLTNFYLLELASNYINALTRRNIFVNKKVEDDFKQISVHVFNDKFLETINSYSEHPDILILYKKMLDMFVSLQNIHLFHNYRSAILKSIESFSADEKFFHYSKLITYCSLRIIANYSDVEIRRELAHIGKEIIHNKYFITARNKYIGVPLFRIFLDNFMYLKDMESVELVLDKCVPCLEENFKNTHKSLAEMYLEFLKGNFEESLSYLGKINIEYFQIVYIMKGYSIKIHYHLNNKEQSLSEIDNYLKFLSSNKNIPKDKRAKESDFAKTVKRIVIAESKNKHDEISYLNHIIQKNPTIANKEWLLEITNDHLEKNKKIKIAY